MKRLPVSIFASAATILVILISSSTPAHAQASETECWAVIAGVSDYQWLNDLNYVDDSAWGIYEQLSPVWGEDNVRLLLDEECKKSDIMAAIDWLAAKDDTGDTVLFYFLGHGDSGYIAPYDAYFEPTWISASELDRKLDKLDAKRVTIILDTCFAGQFESYLRDDGRVVLMSSRSTETSMETSALEHAIFTHFVLEALERFDDADTNHDFELSAEEVFQYAEQETVSYTIMRSISQHPVLSDSYQGELGLLTKFIFRTNLDTWTELIVDGEQILSIPSWFIWHSGSIHDIEVPSLIDEGNNTRLIFVSWDDGVTSISRMVQKGIYTANYQRQYLLTIESAYGEPEGAGWYDEGSTATISLASIEEPTVRHNFTGWSGDYSGDTASATVYMNEPKTVAAEWRTEYLLAIESAYGEPEGEGWYDEGSTATISITSVEEPTIRRHFVGWSGDYAGDEETASITMQTPKMITANWRSEYLLTVESAYGEPEGAGWYDEGSIATISVPESVGVIVRHFFTGWSGDITGGAPATMLVVDSPIIAIAEWRTDYTQLIILIAGLVVIFGIIVTVTVVRHRRKVM